MCITDNIERDDAADLGLDGHLTFVLSAVIGPDVVDDKGPRVGAGYPLRLEPLVRDERVVADRQQVAVYLTHPRNLQIKLIPHQVMA